MKFEIKIYSIKDKESLILETKNYFKNNGFGVWDEENNCITIRRGNTFLNKFVFNPLKWKSEIKIFFNREGFIFGEFYIDTTNQVITSKDRRKWENFISNYKRIILLKSSDTAEKKRIKLFNLF